jgi:hypothetical protein
MIENERSGIFKYNDDKNIFIIGDIHGDYQCLIHCLVDLCKVCKITKIYKDDFEVNNREYLEWNMSNSIVVFCGDLIHRKRFEDHVLDDECSDIYIIQTLLRLKNEARKSNGDIILISGNHEIMNITQTDENIYTSPKNLKLNTEYFSNTRFVNEYILNSYAWIKINDILIAHGGLCSDYLDYIDLFSIDLKGDEIIKFVNDKYHDYFKNFNLKNIKKDKVGYNLFIDYDLENKLKHNMFWCREWGYDAVDCDNYTKILKKIDCKKMIIAHCPQFLSPEKPKMINFECYHDEIYNLARIDLGMSRSFDYNKPDNFLFYLNNNYNRKMSVLKLEYINSQLIFNDSGIITEKISCIQYLLLKYGLKLDDWKNKNINTNWIGFNYIDTIVNKIIDHDHEHDNKNNVEDNALSSDTICSNILTKSRNKKNSETEIINQNTIIMCILYPLVKIDVLTIPSIKQFNELITLNIKSKMTKIKKIKKIIMDL